MNATFFVTVLALVVFKYTHASNPSYLVTKAVIDRGLNKPKEYTKDYISPNIETLESIKEVKYIYSTDVAADEITDDTITKKLTSGTQMKSTTAPICRSTTEKPTSLSVTWSDKNECTEKASFYLCLPISVRKTDFTNKEKCFLLSKDVVNGAVMMWTALDKVFFEKVSDKYYDTGKKAYVYVDTTALTTKAGCAKRSSTSPVPRVMTLQDSDCGNILSDIAAKKKEKEREIEKEKEKEKEREAAPARQFALFVFVYLPLIILFLCCIIECFKYKMYYDDDAVYKFPFLGAEEANDGGKQTTIDEKGREITSGSGEQKISEKQNEIGVKESECPKCDQKIVRPMNEKKWQCKYCGCIVTLSEIGDVFINADDSINSSERNTYDTLNIGPIEFISQSQQQLDGVSVSVTQKQNAATGLISVTSSNSTFQRTAAGIGARATCGAYQYTKVQTGGQRHGARGRNGNNGSNGLDGSRGRDGNRGRPGGQGGNGGNGTNGSPGQQGTEGESGTSAQPLIYSISGTSTAVTLNGSPVQVGKVGRILLDAHGGNGGHGGSGGSGGRGGDGGCGGRGGKYPPPPSLPPLTHNLFHLIFSTLY